MCQLYDVHPAEWVAVGMGLAYYMEYGAAWSLVKHGTPTSQGPCCHHTHTPHTTHTLWLHSLPLSTLHSPPDARFGD